MMINRPLTPAVPAGRRGHSEAPMQPQEWQKPQGVGPRPIIRTAQFGFKPRVLQPVNVVRGHPRLYG